MAKSQVLDMSRHLFRTSVPVFIIWTSLLTFVALTPVSNSDTNLQPGAPPPSTNKTQNDDYMWQFLLENFSASKSFVTGKELDNFIKRFQHCNIESNNLLSDDNSNQQQNSKEFGSLIAEPFCDGKVCNKSVVVGEGAAASASKSAWNNRINGEQTDLTELSSSASCNRQPPWRLPHENYNDVESVNRICHQLLFHIANPECCRTPVVTSTLLSRDEEENRQS